MLFIYYPLRRKNKTLENEEKINANKVDHRHSKMNKSSEYKGHKPWKIREAERNNFQTFKKVKKTIGAPAQFNLYKLNKSI